MRTSKRMQIAAAFAAVAVGCSLLGLGTAAPAVASGSAEPQVRAKPAGPLSVRLRTLSSVAARGAAPSAAAESSVVGLPANGPGSLLHSRDGRLIVEVRTADTSKATIARLRTVGSVVGVAKRWRTTTLAIAPTRLAALARIPGVQSATESLAPVLNSTAPNAAGVAPAAANAGCGSVRSEAYQHLNVGPAQNHDFVDGTGQTVGIISDSFGNGSANVVSGDLPGRGNPCGRFTPVKVVADTPGTDEGRAMAQVVHDVAPGAALDFATGNGGMMTFASNIAALKAAGAHTIVDDLTYFAEPFFQDGPVSVAVNDATADNRTNYFSAAGNENVIVGGQDVGSYEAAKYRPTACPAAVAAYGAGESNCHDFDPGAATSNGDTMNLADGGELVLDMQYAEPWFGVTDDFDLFITDATTGEVLASSTNDNRVSQQPFEFAAYFNSTGDAQDVRVVIARHAGRGRPRVKFVMEDSAGLNAVEFAISSGPDVIGPTIFGHNGAAKTTSVAAVPASSTTTPEDYSSHGPVTLLFGPVDGSTPAAPLAAAKRLAKPDIAASDCVSTTMFRFYPFCGTSAAAPNAAAVAALLRERNLKAGAKAILNKLNATASPLSGGTAQSVGSGLVNAGAAVSAIGGAPVYSKFTDAGMNYPLSIAAGPDGALWVGTYGGSITRVATNGAITNFPDARIGYTDGIAAGSDGNVWFTNRLDNQIGRITPAGVVTIFTDATLSGPSAITAGPDGALWFLNATYPNYSVGRITVGGVITRYTDPSINQPMQITAGPDGALWFTNYGPPASSTVGSIGRITTAGAVTSYTSPGAVYNPDGIAVAADGTLWFSQAGAPGRIGRISTTGVFSPFLYDASIADANYMTSGPDGAIWFADEGGSATGDESIGRITLAGVVTKFNDPSITRPFGIVAGPDGNVWTANFDSKTIGRVTDGFRQVSAVTDPSIDAPSGIANGPGGVLWYTNRDGNSIARVSTAGVVTNFTDPTIDSPADIVAGTDKALWFTNSANHSIGRITWKGAVTNFTAPGIGVPSAIAAGPDGALWFTTLGDGLGRITTAGAITMFHDPRISRSLGITVGPDGALWFTDIGAIASGSGAVGRMTTDGTVSVFTDPSIHTPSDITAGPDGALWYSDSANAIGRITTDGTVTSFTGSGLFAPTAITSGPDGALWFANGSGLGRMTTSGSFTAYPTAGYAGAGAHPVDLTTGPDSQLWFTGSDNVIGRVNRADHS